MVNVEIRKNENKNEKEELEFALAHFIGTENYYKHFTGLLYTDGVKYLADKARAYWLIDLIASWQIHKEVRDCPFQIWELKVNEDMTAVATMKEDTDKDPVVEQKIDYTDFPLDEIKLYLVDGVLMLPTEY